MTSIKFINHASVIISNDKISLLSDPWYWGTAFHDGWSLICENKEEDIKDMSYEIIDQINDIDTIIEDMELDLLKAATMNWEHQQKAEESLKKMDDIPETSDHIRISL